MTTIHMASHTPPVLQQLDVVDDGIESAGPPTYLTPEALMAYCQSRLKGIDTQVDAAMTEQQNINWEQSSIGSILQELNADSANLSNGLMTNPAECLKLEQELESLISQIQTKDPGCSQLGALEQLHDSVMATGTGPFPQSDPSHGYYYQSNAAPGALPDGPNPPNGVNDSKDGAIGADEFTDFTNALTQVNSSLNSGAELQMINIQSLMSDRSNAIQLTTSILQSYDDGLSKIAENVGK